MSPEKEKMCQSQANKRGLSSHCRAKKLPCPRDSDLEQVGRKIQRTDAAPSESNRMRRGGHEHGLYY